MLNPFTQSGDMATLVPMSTNPKHLQQIYNTAETLLKVLGKVVKVTFNL